MTQEQLDAILKDQAETLQQKETAYYSWLQNIVTIAVALLGILISFKTVSQNIYQSVSFIVTISLLLLGILCGAIALYAPIRTLTLVLRKRADIANKLNAGELEDYQEIAVETPLIYQYLQRVSLGLFVIALVSLTVYALSGELNYCTNF